MATSINKGMYGLSGSGMDVDDMVKKMMQAQQSRYDKMFKSKTKTQWQKTAYNDFYNTLTKFRFDTLTNYKTQSVTSARAAKSFDENIVSATANGEAAEMSHDIAVKKLAKSAYLQSAKPITRSNSSADTSINLPDILDLTKPAGASEDDIAVSFVIKDTNAADDKGKLVTYTYKDLAGKTLNDLASDLNKLDMNIRASYDSVNDTFSIRNKNSGDKNTVDITLYEGGRKVNGVEVPPPSADAVKNTKTLFANLHLASYDSDTKTLGAEVNLDTTDAGGNVVGIKIAGQSAAALIDGKEYTADTNRITVNGVSYTLNKLSAYTEITDASGNPVYEDLKDKYGNIVYEDLKDADGNIVYEPKKDADGNIIYEPERDADGNIVYEDKKDEHGNIVYEKKKDANGNIVYEPEKDSSGNIIYEDKKDANGNIIYEPERDPGGNIIYEDKKDEHGNIIYENQKDADGNDVLGSDGLPIQVPVQVPKDSTTPVQVPKNSTTPVMVPVQVPKDSTTPVMVPAKSNIPVKTTTTAKNYEYTKVNVTNDTEAIVKTVKKFVEDYNKLIDSLNTAIYQEQYKDYQPLTSDEKSAMSEDEIKKWEEKAKSGLMKNDSILRETVNGMRSAISGIIGGIGKYNSMANIGITTTDYTEHGKLKLDDAGEKKLREALEADPDAVYKVFSTASDETDASGKALSPSDTFSTDGIAERLSDVMKATMDKIALRGGISAEEDQSVLGLQITSWQEKMKKFQDQMDVYQAKLYKQFNAMESAIASLNSQASFIASYTSGS